MEKQEGGLRSFILPYFVCKPYSRGKRKYREIFFYIGSCFLLFYLVDMILFSGAFTFLKGENCVAGVSNMAAFLVLVMAVEKYLLYKGRTNGFLCFGAVLLADFVIVANGAWNTAFTVLFMILFYTATAVPRADCMMKLAQMFFAIGFCFCNIPLLTNSGLFKNVKTDHCLEMGLVGEIFLCILALYVYFRWSKIPEGIEINRIRMVRLQKDCRFFLKAMLQFFVFFAVLSLIDGKLENGNLIQLISGEKWNSLENNLIVTTTCNLLKIIYESIARIWKGNIAAVLFRLYGWGGVVIGVLIWGTILFRVLTAMQMMEPKKYTIFWTAATLMAGLFFCPVTVYVLPVYFIYVFWAVREFVTEEKTGQEM